MRVELTEVHWLDQQHELSLTELAELSGLPEPQLRELVDVGALTPVDATAAHWTFRVESIAAARTAHRLRDDFELDPAALALALSLVDRIHDLEAQLNDLRAHLPRRLL